MRVGSLFSGIGGLDLGLERAGMEIVWQVEIDEWCRRVLARHFPNAVRYGDVRDCHGAAVADAKGAHEPSCDGEALNGQASRDGRPTEETRGRSSTLPPVDLICGGFPCTPVSVAGRRLGAEDERWLWPEFHRIVREARPRWVVVENVPGLRSIDDGRLFGEVLRDLARCGYAVEWNRVSAAAVGAPHLRERVFIVAHAQGNGRRQDGQSQHSKTGGARYVPNALFGQRFAEQRGVGNDGWWAVEPDVCRMVDGISERLDGDIDASARMGAEGYSREGDETCMRTLWDDVATVAASRGWRQDEQLAHELANLLCLLPHEISLGTREAALEAGGYVRDMRAACSSAGLLRDAQQPLQEAWQSASEEDQGWLDMAARGGHWVREWAGVPRVAMGVEQRVDRLRGLGNSVVPQVAEYIGRLIMEKGFSDSGNKE